jgi:hypothetical protein
MTFLTPLGALVALAGSVPVAAVLSGRRRAAAVRRLLRLRQVRGRLLEPAALAVAAVLAGLACAQPVITTEVSRSSRAHTELFVVLDTSRSMLASANPGAPTRFERAVDFGEALRSRVRDVPFGLASFTDRVLPHLFPTLDGQVFATTLRGVMGIDSPPPAEEGVQATWFGALGGLVRGNFFAQQTEHRIAVVVTDGESRPFQAEPLRRVLYRGTRVDLLVVGVGSRSEAIYDGVRPESEYRPDPAAGASLRELAAAAGSRVYGIGDSAAVASRVERIAAADPREPVAAGEDAFALAPYALVLAALFAGLPSLLRSRAFSPAANRHRVALRQANPNTRTSTAREVS